MANDDKAADHGPGNPGTVVPADTKATDTDDAKAEKDALEALDLARGDVNDDDVDLL
jgi:hypothetical protein